MPEPSWSKIAEFLGAPIVKSLLGKSCIPADSPYRTGGIGLLGTLPSEDAMEACDTLLIVGSSFPYLEYYPKPGKAKCVQIDADPARTSAFAIPRMLHSSAIAPPLSRA